MSSRSFQIFFLNRNIKRFKRKWVFVMKNYILYNPVPLVKLKRNFFGLFEFFCLVLPFHGCQHMFFQAIFSKIFRIRINGSKAVLSEDSIVRIFTTLFYFAFSISPLTCEFLWRCSKTSCRVFFRLGDIPLYANFFYSVIFSIQICKNSYSHSIRIRA